MGRQFTYYCLAEDLDCIQSTVFRPANGQLIAAEKVDGKHHIVPVDRFAIDYERMGKETLSLYLLPPSELRREVRSGPWIDSMRSHLIEVDRCFTDGKVLRSGRFWYETRFFEGSQQYKKPQGFVAWAEGVFRATKRTLERHPINHHGRTYAEWFGAQAWSEVSTGRLTPISN